MEIRLSPEEGRILAESDGPVPEWSPEHCLVIARVARDFKPLMSTDGLRGVLERVALHLEGEAAAKRAGLQGP